MENVLPVQEYNKPITKEIKIGSKEFIIRPWLTKEEKNFHIEKSLLEKKGKEPNIEEIYKILYKTLIEPCVIDGDASKLSFEELKFLMIELKKISSGEVQEGIIIKCPGCKTALEISVDLDTDISFESFDDTFQKIKDNFEIKFKPIPVSKIKENKEAFDYVYESIDEIKLDGKLYKDFTKDNWNAFFDSLPLNDTKKIAKLLEETFAKFNIQKKVKCIKKDCEYGPGTDKKIEVKLGDDINFYLP